MNPKVSVVIPTCRRPELLRRCLDALLLQRYRHDAFEIVVVDDARSAETRMWVELLALDHATGPAIRYLQTPPGPHGPAAARNAGWRAALAPVIAFTDDDTIPDPHWLHEGMRAMHGDVDAICGRIVVPRPEIPTDWERNTANLENAGFVTANCFVRRDKLEAAGGFDERFTRPWREDSDLYFALLALGCVVESAPRAVVVHPVRPAPAGISLRLQRNMYFDALLYKKHPAFYRQKIAATPPLRYYLTVAMLLVALLAGLQSAKGVAFAALAIWALLTLRFALQRLRGTRKTPAHIADMLLTSAAIPVLAVYWRLAGALHFRVLFA